MNEMLSVPARLKALRLRANVTMLEVAKALGLKGISSYQRYEDESRFRKKYLPVEFVSPLVDLMKGRGEPPISEDEILKLAGVEEFTGNIAGSTARIRQRIPTDETPSSILESWQEFGLHVTFDLVGHNPISRPFLIAMADAFFAGKKDLEVDLSGADIQRGILMLYDLVAAQYGGAVTDSAVSDTGRIDDKTWRSAVMFGGMLASTIAHRRASDKKKRYTRDLS
jgi:hypothetical protein